MGKMDIKYTRVKCDHGTKCNTILLAKNTVDGMFTLTYCPKKVFKTESSGVDNLSTLRSYVTVDVMKPRTLHWLKFMGVKMLLGRSECGHGQDVI
jgi:hypothetical protein